jgi:hypothetical protein
MERVELKKAINTYTSYTDKELDKMKKISCEEIVSNSTPKRELELKNAYNRIHSFDKYTDKELEEMEKISSEERLSWLTKFEKPKRRVEPDWTEVADFLNEKNGKTPWENFYRAYLAAEWKVKSGMNTEFCFFYYLLLDKEGPPPNHVVIKDEKFWNMLWNRCKK